jgi:hypothetical protein
MNRLADATSPYLQQHKDNPVDWWPWSPEAFAEARKREVPVLLSVGYAACHWCQVTQEHGESVESQVSAFVAVRDVSNRSTFSALVRRLICLPRLSTSPDFGLCDTNGHAVLYLIVARQDYAAD